MTEIFFGTNRNGRPAKRPTEFGRHFSAVGLTNLRFGKATVDGKTTKIQTYSEKLKRAGRVQRTDDVNSRFGSKELFKELRSRMSQQETDAILFIHGYNVTFNSPWKKSRRRSGPFRRLRDERLSRRELPAAN